MKINVFKDNSIFVIPKVITNEELLFTDTLEDVYIVDTSEKYIIMKYKADKSLRKILRFMMKEPNLLTYSIEDGYIIFKLFIPESKRARVNIIQKCGYSELLKSEIIDLVLFYKEHSINVLRYYEKTLAARDEQSGFISFNQVSLFDFHNIYVQIQNHISIRINYVEAIT